MSKDKLKSFIDANKDQFDSEEPRSGLWDNISNKMDGGTRVFSIWRVLPYAATIALLLSIGVFFFNQDGQNEVSENSYSEEFGLAGLSDELQEVEQYYLVQVNEKLKDLKKYEVDEELLSEVNELKKEFDDLKIEMGIGADPAKVIEAMIDNYRLRLAILEDLLEAMEDSERFNEIENETTL